MQKCGIVAAMTTTDEIAGKLDGLIREVVEIKKIQDRLFGVVCTAIDDSSLRMAMNDLDKDVINSMKMIALLASNTTAIRDALRKQDALREQASPKPERGQDPKPE